MRTIETFGCHVKNDVVYVENQSNRALKVLSDIQEQLRQQTEQLRRQQQLASTLTGFEQFGKVDLHHCIHQEC